VVKSLKESEEPSSGGIVPAMNTGEQTQEKFQTGRGFGTEEILKKEN
jgi:hypothetical protein